MNKVNTQIVCTFLTLGLVACAPVDAQGVVKRKGQERCAGILVKAGRNAGAKGIVAMADIKAKGKQCTYMGSIPLVPSKKQYTFKDRKKALTLYQKYITENDACDPETSLCLVDTGVGMTKAQRQKRAGAAVGGAVAGAGAAAGASVAGAMTSVATLGASTAGASVLAAGAAPALVVAAPVAIARGVQNVKCKKMCQGYFVSRANEKGLKVLLNAKDIKHTITGVGRNRKCTCLYSGPARGVPKQATFLQRQSRKNKETAELKAYASHGQEPTCNVQQETCIKENPTNLNDKQQCLVAFWQHGKTNGMRGTITEKGNVVTAKSNGNKLTCAYNGSIADMPKELTIDNDPNNVANRVTYARQMHLGNYQCKGQNQICLYIGQRQ